MINVAHPVEIQRGARRVCRRKPEGRRCQASLFRRKHGEIPWSFGLGMHWFRKMEREGASKSLHAQRLNWFKSGGLLERDRTKCGTIMVEHRAEKRNYVKKPLKRYAATCSSRIGSVSIFDVKVPRNGKKSFKRFVREKVPISGRAVPDGSLRRFATCISSISRTPSRRFLRRARNFVNSVFIRGAGHKVPYMLKKVPYWECLVLLNFKRLGHQGVLKWWSKKFPPEPSVKLPRGCNFCVRRRSIAGGCTQCAAVRNGCGICEGKCADCLFPPFCENRRLPLLRQRWVSGDFSGPKFGTNCGPCGCKIGNFFPK